MKTTADDRVPSAASVAALLRERRIHELERRARQAFFDEQMDRKAMPLECLRPCCRTVQQLEAELAMSDTDLIKRAGWGDRCLT